MFHCYWLRGCHVTCFNRINSGLFYIINNPTLSFDEFESLLVGPFKITKLISFAQATTKPSRKVPNGLASQARN